MESGLVDDIDEEFLVLKRSENIDKVQINPYSNMRANQKVSEIDGWIDPYFDL